MPTPKLSARIPSERYYANIPVKILAIPVINRTIERIKIRVRMASS